MSYYLYHTYRTYLMLVIHYRFLLPTFSLSFSVPRVHFLRVTKSKNNIRNSERNKLFYFAKYCPINVVPLMKGTQ